MIFVDTNVFMYAVGRPHPLRGEAQRFFEDAMDDRRPLATSAEVLQELLHAYLPVGRLQTLDAAWTLALAMATIWPVEADDVAHARALVVSHGGLGARDLLHLACCQRRKVDDVKTFDTALSDAWGR
jgi:predicted nucleic acid-binding protein